MPQQGAVLSNVTGVPKPIYGNRYNTVHQRMWWPNWRCWKPTTLIISGFVTSSGLNRMGEKICRPGRKGTAGSVLKYRQGWPDDAGKLHCRPGKDGCNNVWMGAESGSQRILDAMDKGTTVQQIFEAQRLLKKKTISTLLSLFSLVIPVKQGGYYRPLTWSMPSFHMSWAFHRFYPLPGTMFYENVKHGGEKPAGLIQMSWRWCFANTFSPAFYKQLHRYVHKIIKSTWRWKQSGSCLKNRHGLRLVK